MNHLIIQTEAMLYAFRKQILADSKTAKSIDRNDSWEKVATCAKNDGFLELAAQLEKSKHQLFETTH